MNLKYLNYMFPNWKWIEKEKSYKYFGSYKQEYVLIQKGNSDKDKKDSWVVIRWTEPKRKYVFLDNWNGE